MAAFPISVFISASQLFAAQLNALVTALNTLNPSGKGSIFGSSTAGTPSELLPINGNILVSDSSATAGISWIAMISAGKNFIINGGMDIWQRGTSSGSGGYQTADRWYENATASTTFAQEATVVPTGSKYSFKMTAGATATMNISQAIETSNSLPLVSQTVTASAQVQASVSTGMTIQLYYSTSVDNPASGSWTSIAATSGGTGTATSGTFTKISGVFSVPSTAKSLFLQITTTSTVANGVIVYVGQTQLEIGPVATPFSRAGGSIGGELALCQRYYYRVPATTSAYGAFGTAYSTTSVAATLPLKTTMRVIPTAVDFSNVAVGDVANAAISATTVTISGSAGSEMATILITGAVGLTQYRPYYLTGSAGTGYVGLSAEL